ncbi:MAG: hypothetical protein AAGF25_14450 [Pseudomonadota bacterium]
MANIFTSLLVTMAVAGGTVLGLYEPAMEEVVEEGETAPMGGSYIELDMIAVPYVADNIVQGYLVSRLTLNLSPDASQIYGNEFIPRIQDIVNRQLFMKLGALRKTKPYEIHEVVAASLAEEINVDFGSMIVHGVFVNQLEYLDKASVRTPRESGKLTN